MVRANGRQDDDAALSTLEFLDGTDAKSGRQFIAKGHAQLSHLLMVGRYHGDLRGRHHRYRRELAHDAVDFIDLLQVEPRRRDPLAILLPAHALKQHREIVAAESDEVLMQRRSRRNELAPVEQLRRQVHERRVGAVVSNQLHERALRVRTRKRGRQCQPLHQRQAQAVLFRGSRQDDWTELLVVAGQHNLRLGARQPGQSAQDLWLVCLARFVHHDMREVPRIDAERVQHGRRRQRRDDDRLRQDVLERGHRKSVRPTVGRRQLEYQLAMFVRDRLHRSSACLHAQQRGRRERLHMAANSRGPVQPRREDVGRSVGRCAQEKTRARTSGSSATRNHVQGGFDERRRFSRTRWPEDEEGRLAGRCHREHNTDGRPLCRVQLRKVEGADRQRGRPRLLRRKCD
eukprot:Opistho-1_new@85302